jgi:hypothetical protein
MRFMKWEIQCNVDEVSPQRIKRICESRNKTFFIILYPKLYIVTTGFTIRLQFHICDSVNRIFQ